MKISVIPKCIFLDSDSRLMFLFTQSLHGSIGLTLLQWASIFLLPIIIDRNFSKTMVSVAPLLKS